MALVTVLSAAGLLGASACGAAGGEAAGPGGASPAASSENTPSESAEPSSASPAETDPCAWLTPAERSTAGLAVPGERRTVGSVPACDYTEQGAGGVTVTFDTTSALADLRPDGEATPLRIAGREAQRVADPVADDGTCTVLLAAGSTSSVHIDVSTADFRGTRESCERASTVAELIAPDLPGRTG
ncbi:hypothetical protein FHS23_002333 [Prauserella isguenensis]|uniref:DUF3558 domain-containing protein n=1 Tax=Prauserella isguenensis TaxID=1470180 RepID=A0A839S2M5_9PSEU|nr:hypothetical protein [Prauserella isguenensis]